MVTAPGGTPVGVDDPYEHVAGCDHLTDDGRCRLAAERPSVDPAFASERRRDGYRCPVAAAAADEADASPEWSSCPHFRSRERDRTCVRCGLEERRLAHEDARPLLEEHHLSYADDDTLSHEIAVYLCRWCHAKVHRSWARLDDDVNPDPEAIAAREGRRSRELSEASFATARERRAAGREDN